MKAEGTLISIEGYLRDPVPMSAEEFNARQRAFYATTYTFSGRRLTPEIASEETKAAEVA